MIKDFFFFGVLTWAIIHSLLAISIVCLFVCLFLPFVCVSQWLLLLSFCPDKKITVNYQKFMMFVPMVLHLHLHSHNEIKESVPPAE